MDKYLNIDPIRHCMNILITVRKTYSPVKQNSTFYVKLNDNRRKTKQEIY